MAGHHQAGAQAGVLGGHVGHGRHRDGDEHRPAAGAEEQQAELSRIRRPCLLLDEDSGRCRAYDARPVNCRRENSEDAEVCRRYRDDPDATASSLRFVRYELIWGAVQAYLACWAAEEAGVARLLPLETALALALAEG